MALAANQIYPIDRPKSGQSQWVAQVPSAVILQLRSRLPVECEPVFRRENYRDSVCELCERTVSIALNVSLSALRSKTRSTADVAFARQIAMYLANTMFNLPATEVGLHFKRDRTTVAHACALIEDRRDDLSFEVMLEQLEALLAAAIEAGNNGPEVRATEASAL